MNRSLLELISEYQACVNYLCSLFGDYYKNLDEDGIMRSYRVKIIPKEGYLGKIYFCFHGAGCYFKTETDEVELDFGPYSRCDGFDKYRLFYFLQNRRSKYPDLLDEDYFSNEFDKLVTGGVISKLPPPHVSELFYWKDSVEAVK